MFQSAPAIAGGRCVAGAGAIFTVRGFNPRPPLLAGDAPPLCGRQLCPAVSIRARHCWRAMPAQGRVPRLRPKFQSAPAIAGGRCGRASASTAAGRRFQSAPAIAGGRCSSGWTRCSRSQSFNPRPPLLAGDAPSPTKHITPVRFQSAPAIAGGRCWRASMSGAIYAAFQSAPAIAGGRCRRCREVDDKSKVSIRARHCWRAMRAPGRATFP